MLNHLKGFGWADEPNPKAGKLSWRYYDKWTNTS